MKKLIFSFALLTLLSSTALAQSSFGLKAGGMLANKTGTSLSLNLESAKFSYLAGVFYGFPVSEKFGLQIELLYTNKGQGEAGMQTREDFHYLNLPIMLQYSITERFRVELGPEVSYLLSQKQWFTFGTQSPSPFTKNFDAALNLGTNYTFLERLVLGLRYNLGVYDITKAPGEIFPNDPSEDFKTINRTLQLSVGWKLGK